jgi:signal transduction histidine kinase
MRRGSLISRFALSTALLAAVVVLLAVVFFQVLHGDFFRVAFGPPLEDWSATVAGRIRENPELARAVAQRHEVGIVVPDGDSLIAFGPDGEPVDPETLLAQSSGVRRIHVGGSGEPGMTFLWHRADFVREHNRLLFGLVVLLLVTIGVTYAVQLSQLRPLAWLRGGVDAVSRGDFTTRVPIKRQDEIGQVAQAFNEMTRRVEQMMADRERLLADVSHELRSPLARIKVALELLPASEKREQIARDVREMESLTTVLLERERISNQADHLAIEPVDIAALAREVAASFADRKPSVEIEVALEKTSLEADPALLRILIHNLVDNAVKFSSGASSPVRVGIGRVDSELEITVDDQGPGISRQEAARLFDPFVKLDAARGHHSGYGLGLNLCLRIVEAHHGSIELVPRSAGGTRARVRLPLA